MAFEAYEYNNPEHVLHIQQVREIKHTQGCAACEHRGQRVLGLWLCGIGKYPGKLGFCKHWQHDEGVIHAASNTDR